MMFYLKSLPFCQIWVDFTEIGHYLVNGHFFSKNQASTQSTERVMQESFPLVRAKQNLKIPLPAHTVYVWNSIRVHVFDTSTKPTLALLLLVRSWNYDLQINGPTATFGVPQRRDYPCKSICISKNIYSLGGDYFQFIFKLKYWDIILLKDLRWSCRPT